jgi:hypothetical protein
MKTHDEVLGSWTGKIDKQIEDTKSKYDLSIISKDPVHQAFALNGIAVRDFFDPYQRNQTKLRRDLGQKVEIKALNDASYVYDYVGGHGLIKVFHDEIIGPGHLSGIRGFDEEFKKWVEHGTAPFKVAGTDPVDNSDPWDWGYPRCINNAAWIGGETEASTPDNPDYEMDFGCVVDFQTDAVWTIWKDGVRLFYADMNTGEIEQQQDLDGNPNIARVGDTTEIKGSIMAIPACKAPRRVALAKSALGECQFSDINIIGPLASLIFCDSIDHRIEVIADPFVGQPLYEVLYLAGAHLAGAHIVGIVADVDDKVAPPTEWPEFSFNDLLKPLLANPQSKLRYRFIAAWTKELLDNVIEKAATV